MIHLRTDAAEKNEDRTFACGIGPGLPPGDKWVGESEYGLHRLVDCDGCGASLEPLGTPISQLSGRPSTRGYAKFVEISRSWGYP